MRAVVTGVVVSVAVVALLMLAVSVVIAWIDHNKQDDQ